MSLALCLVLILQFWITSAGFVSVQGTSFELDGSPFNFYGTNLYWANMASDSDLDLTFHSIASANYTVVRVWAFNDVASVPSSGTFFQVLSNGTATINTGPNGLQQLDQVVASAASFGLKLVLTLTNNWNPSRPTPSTSFSRRQDSGSTPRGTLSNDYGGIDAYVRAFSSTGTHDSFYTDPTIITAFENYLAQVIPRYANSSTVLAWELGNDIRCSSTLPASSTCNTTTITNWVSEVSGFVKTLDSNHLITAGDHGFYCLGCPKLFATKSTPPSNLLTGPSFDGSFGVDTEDIMSIFCISFGSFQLFPDQVDYFPATPNVHAVKAIGDGTKWIALHAASAALIGKPEGLTAASVVTEDHFSSLVLFNETEPAPAGTPCGGVQQFQQEYAITSWGSVALGSIGGVLEYMWLQNGLTGQNSQTGMRRRQLTTMAISPQDGNGNYNGAASGQNVMQFEASLPPIP